VIASAVGGPPGESDPCESENAGRGRLRRPLGRAHPFLADG